MPLKTVYEAKIEHLQILDEDGKLDEKLAKDTLTDEEVAKLYEFMILCRHYDEIAFKLQRSGRMGTWCSPACSIARPTKSRPATRASTCVPGAGSTDGLAWPAPRAHDRPATRRALSPPPAAPPPTISDFRLIADRRRPPNHGTRNDLPALRTAVLTGMARRIHDFDSRY